MKKWITMFCLMVLMLLTTGSNIVLANDTMEQKDYKIERIEENRLKETKEKDIKVNTLYTGQLAKQYDKEKYNFTLSNAGMINISFSHANLMDGDIYWIISIYNADRECVLEMESIGTAANAISGDVGLPAGDYYMQVKADYYSSESYTFKINYTVSADWEKEKNDEKEDASAISVNRDYMGANQTKLDGDYYKFWLEKAGKLNIDFKHAQINDKEIYWVIRLYNDANECLLELSSLGTDTLKSSADIGLPAGKYYIRIFSGYKSNYGSKYSTLTYTFKINYMVSDYWEKEENDEKEDASAISVNTVYNGANQTKLDGDYYKFWLEEAGKLNIDFRHALINDKEIYWGIRLYNDANECLLELSSLGTDTLKSSADIGLPAGKYYIRIFSGYKSGYSSYYSDTTYSFNVNYVKTSNWETEKNNSYNDADEIKICEEYNGANQFYNEADYYKFTIENKCNYTITFNHVNLQDKNRYWNVTVHNKDGKTLLAFDVSGKGTSANSKSIYLEKGTYYLKVRTDDYSGGQKYSDSTYGFKVVYTFTTKKTTVKTASIDYNKIKLSWKKIGDVDGYVVYRSTSKNGTYKAIKTIKGRSKCTYTDKSVKTGKTYYYKVRGYKNVSNSTYYSKYSSALKVKAVPAKASIKSLKVGTKKAIITWKKQSGVSGYEVYMSTKKSSGYKKITTVKKASKVNYTKSKLKEGKIYYFKVRAYKVVKGKKVYGKYSSVKSVRIVWK